jgi:hypothetical protein
MSRVVWPVVTGWSGARIVNGHRHGAFEAVLIPVNALVS